MKQGYKETEIGEIPVEWGFVSVGEICIESRSRNDKLTIGEEKLSGVFKTEGLTPMRDKVKGETTERCKLVPPNALAYNPMRINIGSIARNLSNETLLVSPDYVVFQVRDKSTDVGYLDHFRCSRFWNDFVRKSGDGGVRIRIYFSHLSALRLPIPPLPEQKKIAEILSSVDDAIRATQAVVDQTKKVKQGMLGELLTKGIGHTEFKETEIGEIPVEWDVEPLGAVVEINPSRKTNEAPTAMVSFLSMSDISTDGRVETIQERAYAEVSKGFTVFAPNDVLIAKITPCFENGKGAIVPELKGKVGFGSTEFHVLRAYKEKTTPDFVFAHSMSGRFRKTGEHNMRGSAGQKRVPTDFISQYLVPLPPLPEQQKIAEILSSVDDTIRENTIRIEQLKVLKSGLMQDLLTGAVRVKG